MDEGKHSFTNRLGNSLGYTDSSPSQVLNLIVDLIAVPASAVWHAFQGDSTVVVSSASSCDALTHKLELHSIDCTLLLSEVICSGLLPSDPVCIVLLSLLETFLEAFLKSLLPLSVLLTALLRVSLQATEP